MARPIEPLRTPELVEAAKNFQEPIGAAETIAKYVRRLVGETANSAVCYCLGITSINPETGGYGIPKQVSA
ncbi:hypothetical protein [Agrobacterium rosae]|uniref:hypothetical protein n=1 Tax=Agrobacterium rosae TaxID=1972867 RepID=UPI00387B58CF